MNQGVWLKRIKNILISVIILIFVTTGFIPSHHRFTNWIFILTTSLLAKWSLVCSFPECRHSFFHTSNMLLITARRCGMAPLSLTQHTWLALGKDKKKTLIACPAAFLENKPIQSLTLLPSTLFFHYSSDHVCLVPLATLTSWTYGNQWAWVCEVSPGRQPKLCGPLPGQPGAQC